MGLEILEIFGYPPCPTDIDLMDIDKRSLPHLPSKMTGAIDFFV